MRDLIRNTRALTEKPFGIGIVLEFPHENYIKAILDENVTMMQVFWGCCCLMCCSKLFFLLSSIPLQECSMTLLLRADEIVGDQDIVVIAAGVSVMNVVMLLPWHLVPMLSALTQGLKHYTSNGYWQKPNTLHLYHPNSAQLT